MVSLRSFLLVFGSLLSAVLAAPTLESRQTLQTIPGKYIVTFKPGTDDAKIDEHTAWATNLHRRHLEGRSFIDGDLPAGIERYYKINRFAAYAGSFDDATIAAIRQHADVCSC